jgi:hypothetical protein
MLVQIRLANAGTDLPSNIGTDPPSIFQVSMDLAYSRSVWTRL